MKEKDFPINVLRIGDKDYPGALREIDQPPRVLYVKGNSALAKMADFAVAVVGARRMTAYGREVTRRLVKGLVDAGVTIVSGLALGIDAVAHRTAVEVGGYTIGVLGGGLDRIYPWSNRELAQAMLRSGRGILVSEFPAGRAITRQNFAIRNRIVSGLSRGVLVIEGAAKSGTLLTASAAARQGREVFAVPGPVTSPMSAAPHFLLKNGAKLVESVKDILDELDYR